MWLCDTGDVWRCLIDIHCVWGWHRRIRQTASRWPRPGVIQLPGSGIRPTESIPLLRRADPKATWWTWKFKQIEWSLCIFMIYLCIYIYDILCLFCDFCIIYDIFNDVLTSIVSLYSLSFVSKFLWCACDVNGPCSGDRSPSTPRENLRSSPPPRRMRLRRAIVDSEKAGEGSGGHDEKNEVTGSKEATEGKDGKVKDVKVVKLLKDTDLSNLDLSNRELKLNMLNRKRPAEDTVPTKRSARLASSETSSQVSKMHTPRPFDGKHKGNREDTEKEKTSQTSQTSETSQQNESEVDAANAANAAGEGREEPTTSAAATAVSGEGEEERQQPHQDQETTYVS